MLRLPWPARGRDGTVARVAGNGLCRRLSELEEDSSKPMQHSATMTQAPVRIGSRKSAVPASAEGPAAVSDSPPGSEASKLTVTGIKLLGAGVRAVPGTTDHEHSEHQDSKGPPRDLHDIARSAWGKPVKDIQRGV